MGTLKALRINWIQEAWKIRSVIADIKDRPPGNPLAAEYPRRLELPASKIEALEMLQDWLAQHLTYRMSLQRTRLRPDKGHRWAFNSRIPAYTLEQQDYLSDVVGMKFQVPEQFAIEAHVLIGSTLECGWIAYEDKFELVLLIASISMFGGRVAGTNRAVPRPTADRRSALRRETELAIQNHPGETASEILVRLTDVVVESSDASRVTYWVKQGKLKTITRDRYENVFSDAKRVVDAARRAGRRAR
jgi:hypothetical protein